MGEVSLFRIFDRTRSNFPWVRLGDWPTPVQPLTLPGFGGDLWVKRDDLSSPIYGGNKVRTLESLFGQAQAAGAKRIWATGAYGSNHALATCLHAPRAGLEPAVMLFPQPASECAVENLAATLSARPRIRRLWSWAALPFAVMSERRVPGQFIMVPGGATPEGALGYVSAVLELCGQVADGAMPAPRRIVLGVGSTCTTAGLLAGLALANRLAIPGAFDAEVWPVRVTPWPVTSRFRIVSLAVRTIELLAKLIPQMPGDISRGRLASRLRVIGGHIGRGYGHVTRSGVAALNAFRDAGGPPLDTCYSAKAASGLVATRSDGPTLFWATKSSAPLPARDLSNDAPRPMLDWLDRNSRMANFG